MTRSSRWIGRAAVCVLALAGCGSGGNEPIAEVRWDQTAPDSGRVVDGSVEIDGSVGGGEYPLTTIREPVGGAGYAVIGDVRYEGVVEPAYLEMWSVFPDGGRYFSRTLGAEGPMAAMVGESDWRRFELPFFLEGATSTPSQLELNAVLPSGGRVGWDRSGSWRWRLRLHPEPGGPTGRPRWSVGSGERWWGSSGP